MWRAYQVCVLCLIRVHSSSHTHTRTHFEYQSNALRQGEKYFMERNIVFEGCPVPNSDYEWSVCRDVKMKKHFVRSRHSFRRWLCVSNIDAASWMGAGARARVCVKHLKDVDADMAAMCQALDTDTFSHFESVLIEINAKARQKRYGNKKKMRSNHVGVNYTLK